MRPVIPYVIAAALFGLGVYGVLRRRNAVLVLMAVELMLNAVNLLLVTANAAPLHAALGTAAPVGSPAAPGTAEAGALPFTGQAFTLFVIVIAAAEVGVGLAIVLQLYRLRGTVAIDDVRLDEHTPDAGPRGIMEAPARTGAATGPSTGAATGPSTGAATRPAAGPAR
ncbi:NADH-quinone oxidoreductase subunit K [Plantactinospora sp. S1510]|uniref:NADH-quinone oxidoreductase subunit K n=1 Tax=Plantactinospora alkalitolerans TaxID=2789879 RepID=A0ABS0H6X2_9ACTN|nr:NADH-quinone oxidoreductase subunit NuoK [Plantactinospora alkalitolerans]MBF9134188.1 NADH-quinone oxidoreductase subunit K [Plantactinospora alkalitolerans]